MPVTLTNVTSFGESPGRRRSWRWGEFDQLACTYTGPWTMRDQWLPAVGSRHRDYPFMVAVSVSDVEQDGALVTQTVTYSGQMRVHGLQTPPVVSMRQSETSGSYQVAGQQVVTAGIQTYRVVNNNAFATAGLKGQVVKIGTWTYTVRYLSRTVTIRYQSLVRLISPIHRDLATPIAGYTILTIDRSELSGDTSTDGVPRISVSANHSFPLMCSDFTVDSLAANLFNCSETWEYKYLSTVTRTP